MRSNFDSQISSLLFPPEPSGEPFGKIMLKIQKERMASAKRRIILFSLGMAVSLIALVPISAMLKTSLSQSGFLRYLSIIFFNPEAVLKYWSDFALSIMESIPMFSIAAFLTAILVFLELLKKLAINISNISKLSKTF